MAQFLAFKRSQVRAGDLSARTLGDYIHEMEKYVGFLKPGTPVDALRPEHFSAYMGHMIGERKLGRYARRRVRTYINTLLRYGAKNGWYPMPNTGTDWVAPATDSDSVRQAKLRAGLRDYSDRIVTGDELDQLLERATTAFKAIVLLGVNCGLGPADIGRIRWNAINMCTGRLMYPRPKTGVMRIGYLWKKTRAALLQVRALRQNREAIEREGEAALVFITRRNEPYYREREVHRDIEIDGQMVTKLVGIAVENAVSITFRRMAKELNLEGVHFYRLRHTFKTLAKRARDTEAIDAMMGHKDRSIGKVYDHEEVSWSRIKRVARVVYRRLWPKIKRKEDKRPGAPAMKIAGAVDGNSAVA
ncbi:MAG: tyrosine-type recombinase/integrase [Planctomycetota bacterium]|nr:tyrosine-type recombinase/integrase [Planctomycetota bacterium]